MLPAGERGAPLTGVYGIGPQVIARGGIFAAEEEELVGRRIMGNGAVEPRGGGKAFRLQRRELQLLRGKDYGEQRNDCQAHTREFPNGAGIFPRFDCMM